MLNETETIVVKDFLGDGGQGEVYLVEYNGGRYALKAYKNEESSDCRYNLKNNRFFLIILLCVTFRGYR